MSDKTKIEWTDATWNPVTGCTKVSQGCKNCYAERMWKRLSAMPGTKYTGRKFTDVKCHENVLMEPLRWRKPRMVFVNSMGDIFHEDVPDSFIDKIFAVMALCPQHTFQILTKRPERMRDYFNSFNSHSGCERGYVNCAWADQKFGINDKQIDAIGSVPKGLPNVWLGVSVEDQATADGRIPFLLETPAAIRFMSAEPLLESLNVAWALSRNPMKIAAGFLERGHFSPGLEKLRGLNWAIAGGESGPDARPMHPDWVRSIRDQCADAKTAFFFKGWGAWTPEENVELTHGVIQGATLLDDDKWMFSRESLANYDGHYEDEPDLYRVDKKRAGWFLDGVEHNGMPRIVASTR